MTDTFRKVYRELNPHNSQLIITIKEKAEELERLLSLEKTREFSIALTKLEELTMWATKAVVLFDEKSGSVAIRR